MLTSAMIVYHGSFSCFISGIKLSYILKLSFYVHQKIFMHQLKNKTKQEPPKSLTRGPEPATYVCLRKCVRFYQF